MSTVIQVENLSKTYRLGSIGRGTLVEDLSRVWARVLRKPDPTAKIGRESQARLVGQVFKALDDVSFEVKQGEVFGIVGRNGAGKSTLLKILSRVTAPTSGEVRVKGRIASLLEVGTGFNPELSGRDNIYLNGAILGMKKAEIKRKFDEIVAFSGVEEFIDTPVKRYSSGMYVRLAFAVAAHLEPEILIIDEVLAVGDAQFQKKCLGKMQDVSRNEGRTIIFVSHAMAAVSQLCSRAILIRHGQIVLDSTTPEVVDAYMGDASASVNGEFDLAKHPSRSANGRSIIRKVRLCKANGDPGVHLNPEEPCSIEIEYELAERLRDPRLAVSVEDSQGRRITTFASYFHENIIPELDGKGTARCLINSLGLGTGRYLLSVSIAEKTAGMLDSLDSAMWFEVGWNNNFKNGEPYNPVYGPVLSQSKWRILRRQ